MTECLLLCAVHISVACLTSEKCVKMLEVIHSVRIELVCKLVMNAMIILSCSMIVVTKVSIAYLRARS